MAAARATQRYPDWLTARPAVTVLFFAILLTALNPIGFIGGGGDDYHYLLAARCAAEHGFCVPPDHWWRRWPIVAPTALMLRLFGETHATLAIVPAGYSLGTLALFTTVVARQFGRAAGVVAGVMFAATPVVSQLTLELGIDMPELFFAMLTIVALQKAHDTQDGRWVALAGLAMGMAIQARPTSLTLLPIVIGLLIVTRRTPWIVALVAMAAAPSVLEAVVYALAAGDPLLGWKLSLAHVRIPSTELLPKVDVRQSPLFNPEYIGGWRRAVHVHWTIDGLLNYVLNPAVALTVMAALMLLALDVRRLGRPQAGGPALLFALILGVIWFGALTYGFAINPQPRVFLLPLAVACTVFAVLAQARWATGRTLIVIAFALVMAKGIIASYERLSLRDHTAAAPAMIAAAGPGLTIEARTARFLALVPEAQALPLYDGNSGQREMLLIGEADCANPAAESNITNWHAIRVFSVPLHEPEPIPTLRAHGIIFGPGAVPAMCLMARDQG